MRLRSSCWSWLNNMLDTSHMSTYLQPWAQSLGQFLKWELVPVKCTNLEFSVIYSYATTYYIPVGGPAYNSWICVERSLSWHVRTMVDYCWGVWVYMYCCCIRKIRENLFLLSFTIFIILLPWPFFCQENVSSFLIFFWVLLVWNCTCNYSCFASNFFEETHLYDLERLVANA